MSKNVTELVNQLELQMEIQRQLSLIEDHVLEHLPAWARDIDLWTFIYHGVRNRTFDWKYISLEEFFDV